MWKLIYFYRSFHNILLDVLTFGKVLASREERKKRRALCGRCPHFKRETCEVCGCYLPLKIQFAASECPLEGEQKKWHAT